MIIKSTALFIILISIFNVKSVMLDKTEFWKLIHNEKGSDMAMEVSFSGRTETSGFSGNTYLYYEIINEYEDESESISYVYENSFIIKWKHYSAEISYRNIRTFLPPLKTIHIKKNGKTLSIREYGIFPDRKYYLFPQTETYYLPDSNGNCTERTSLIFYIAEKPFNGSEPPLPVTPAYRNWTY